MSFKSFFPFGSRVIILSVFEVGFGSFPVIASGWWSAFFSLRFVYRWLCTFVLIEVYLFVPAVRIIARLEPDALSNQFLDHNPFTIKTVNL